MMRLLALTAMVALAHGQCGATTGACATAQDPCCSSSGFCGATADFCGTGCQAPYSYKQICEEPTEPNVTLVTQCMNPAHVAITFDDGPFQFSTGISEAFTAAGAFVTFFVNGGCAVQCRRLNHETTRAFTRPKIVPILFRPKLRVHL